MDWDTALQRWAAVRQWKFGGLVVQTTGQKPAPGLVKYFQRARIRLAKDVISPDFLKGCLAGPSALYWLHDDKKDVCKGFVVFRVKASADLGDYMHSNYPEGDFKDKNCILEKAKTSHVVLLEAWCADKGLGSLVLLYSLLHCPLFTCGATLGAELIGERAYSLWKGFLRGIPIWEPVLLPELQVETPIKTFSSQPFPPRLTALQLQPKRFDFESTEATEATERSGGEVKVQTMRSTRARERTKLHVTPSLTPSLSLSPKTEMATETEKLKLEYREAHFVLCPCSQISQVRKAVAESIRGRWSTLALYK